jgi:colicin import membrane protein
MARKLKTYQTSLGFFDQAIAAPSMKAALEAWGADSNLFHQGAAKESKDPDVVSATMAKPGVVLRRPVGSDGPFTEHASLPTELRRVGEGYTKRRSAKPKKPLRKTDAKLTRKAALDYERAEKRRESERRKEETARAREQQRRDVATSKAKAALEKAQQKHERITTALEAERAHLEERSQAEDARWDKEKRKLDLAVRRTRE